MNDYPREISNREIASRLLISKSCIRSTVETLLMTDSIQDYTGSELFCKGFTVYPIKK